MAVETVIPERIGPYRSVRVLAVGGIGQVILAHDEGLDRPVAIKRLRPDRSIDEEKRERMRREARLAAALDHPAIVRVYELFEADGADHIVMPYIEGRDLRSLLEQGPMPERFALDVAIWVADALTLAHDRGVIHRDLKTDNVLITPEGQPKITDFGVAKHLLSDDQSLTHSSAFLGTCRSMAPEQALGEKMDHRCDLFSFGVLLFELFSGVSPFESKNDLVTLRRLTTEPHPPLADRAAGVPGDVAALVDDLLEKSPGDRLSSAEEALGR
ncbi:MAG: serine/threonine protein kinase, partial [Holophagales bacterium]|nr:serine/threonine protein kinase [Holophagales bacterium]